MKTAEVRGRRRRPPALRERYGNISLSCQVMRGSPFRQRPRCGQARLAAGSGPGLLRRLLYCHGGLRPIFSSGEDPVMSVTADALAALRDRAAAVLHSNDAGSWTRAAPVLYPHQWSWDSAFIAIGWAHPDVRGGMTGVGEPFAAQWATGMVPHLVFRAGTDHPYFPGPEWWDTAVSPGAPAPPVKTTGICQPPVHALALQRIWQLTPREQ